VTAGELAARRRLLAAHGTLQRVRLVHDVHTLREACRPPPWSGVALPGAALAAASWARGQTTGRQRSALQAGASVCALRGLTLWRALRALRRVWLADR
jgi:hypothetical protein